jgi:hypothetical protein
MTIDLFSEDVSQGLGVYRIVVRLAEDLAGVDDLSQYEGKGDK